MADTYLKGSMILFLTLARLLAGGLFQKFIRGKMSKRISLLLSKSFKKKYLLPNLLYKTIKDNYLLFLS